jgi:hypothetical protein
MVAASLIELRGGAARAATIACRLTWGDKTMDFARLGYVVMAALLTAPPPALAQSQSLHALLVEYRCPIVDRLDRIYDNPRPTDYLDRFLAVTLLEHPHGYVQCMFIKNRTALLCEASSGYYYDKQGAPRTFYLPQKSMAALGHLGFSTDDTAGNFRYEALLGNPPDFNAVADLILRALHDGYGARAESQLKFNAPFARRATTKCIPVG